MRRFPVFLLFFLLPTLVAAESQRLTAELWNAQPRTGQRVAQLEPVQRILAAYAKDAGNRIVIRYPGGDAGTSWAQELRDWLVALGVSSAQVQLEPGSGGEALVLEVATPGKRP